MIRLILNVKSREGFTLGKSTAQKIILLINQTNSEVICKKCEQKYMENCVKREKLEGRERG